MHRAFWWAVDRAGNRRPAGLPAPPTAPALLVLAAVLVTHGIGGCGAPDGGNAERPGTSRARLDVPTSTTGAGMSVGAYRAALAPAVTQARAGVDALGGAKSHRDLRDRTLKARASIAAATGRLATIDPPAALAEEHAELLASLANLGEELAGAAAAVERRELCAPSAVLARVTSSEAGGRVRAAGAAVAAAGASPDLAGALLPDPVKATNRRLPDGTVLIDRRRTGLGRLKVDTLGTTRDSVVSLVRGGRALVSIYVAPGNRHTLTRIPDGSYQVFQAAGVDYDRRLAAFTRDCSFTRFNDTLRFRTTATSATVYSASLRPVEGGNAKLTDVDPDRFPTS
jgi:hypothetical protein